MKHSLSPLLADLQSESVLYQAWKKTAAFIRSHNWYADTLELDWQALRLPEFIGEIRERLATGKWATKPLRMVPAPKSQVWETTDAGWQPAKAKGGKRPAIKIRPLAHVDLADQVVCTAVMLCLADRVETLQGAPTGSTKTESERKQLLSYGHRLFCDVDDSGKLRHRWGAQKLYRVYSTDYRRFLARPDAVASAHEAAPSGDVEVAVVNADLSRFYDRVRPELLAERLNSLKRGPEEADFFEFSSRLFDWRWHDQKRAAAYGKEAGIEGFERVALPQGLVAAGFFSNVVLLPFDDRLYNSTHQTSVEGIGGIYGLCCKASGKCFVFGSLTHTEAARHARTSTGSSCPNSQCIPTMWTRCSFRSSGTFAASCLWGWFITRATLLPTRHLSIQHCG